MTRYSQSDFVTRESTSFDVEVMVLCRLSDCNASKKDRGSSFVPFTFLVVVCGVNGIISCGGLDRAIALTLAND